MLSEKLAKVPNLLTKTMNSRLCNALKHVAKAGDIRQTTTNRDNSVGLEIYPNFKKNLAEATCHPKKSAKTSQYLANAISVQQVFKRWQLGSQVKK